MRHLCDASPSSWKSQGAGKVFAVERHLGLLLSGASAKGLRVRGLLKSCAVIVPSVSFSSAKLRRMLWRSTFQHIPTWTSHSQPVCTACRDPTRMCSTAPRCLLHSWSRYLDEDLCWLFKVHGTMVGALHLPSMSGQRRRRLHASDV